MTEPFIHTLQQEIDDLRTQAELLPPGRKRNHALARAVALEVTMKTYTLTGAIPLAGSGDSGDAS